MAEEHSVVDMSSSSSVEPLLSARPQASRNLDATTLRANYDALALPSNIFWNFVYTIIVIGMLCAYREELPNTPIKAWLIVYTVHTVVQILMDYCLIANRELIPCVAICGCISAIFYLIWWIFGVHWVASGGDILRHDAPHLFWLTVVLLALRIATTVIACVLVPLVCCCCLPVVAAVAAITAD